MSLRIILLNIFVLIVSLESFGQIELIPIVDQNKSSEEGYYINSEVHKSILNSKHSTFLSSLPFIDQQEPILFKRLDINRYNGHSSDSPRDILHYTAFKKGEYIINLTVADQIVIRHSSGNGNYSYIPDDVGLVNQFTDRPETTNQICQTKTTNTYSPPARTYKSGTDLPPVGVYFEVDHYTYQDFEGDTDAIIEWIEILFAEVAAIYAMDGINLVISEIFIWEQEDLYDSDFLNPTFNAFTDRMATHGFNGHVAQLITTKPFGRGLAYLSEPCSALTESTSIPIGITPRLEKTTIYTGSYDWNRYVLSHEIGHTLGSHHSHDCVWGADNNTAIDDCSNGGCGGSTPTNGGTIMSYCNMTSQGINFANGLGAEPAQRMKDIIANSMCYALDSMCEVDIACDDGDPCTQNDMYDEDCNCEGILLDADENGICDIIESCIENVNIVSTISRDTTIAAEESIVSQGLLKANSEVVFSAGAELTFNPGFEVSSGTKFEAIVRNCSNE